MFKLAFALSALFAVACAVPPLISGVSTVSRVDANIPLAVTSGLRLAAPAVAVAPVLANPNNVVLANGLGNVIVNNGLVSNVATVVGANGLASNVLVNNGLGLAGLGLNVINTNALINANAVTGLSGLAGLINVGPRVVVAPQVATVLLGKK